MVLVNESPIQKFKYHKEPQQGDPLAPFLFLVVKMSLSGLMKETKNKNLVGGYKVGEKYCIIGMLQYDDDTIFFLEVNEKNVFKIKTILRLFELASGLKVIFFKSCFGVIGVESH